MPFGGQLRERVSGRGRADQRDPLAAAPASRARARLMERAGNARLVAPRFSFAYLRVSGIVLLALAFGHLFVVHYANAPASTGASFAGTRWLEAFWRGFDWALLLLALTHGSFGMQGVLSDYVHARAGRAAIGGVLLVLAAGFLAVGTASIVQAAAGVATSGPLSGATWIGGALDLLLGALATLTYAAAALVVAAFAVRAARRLPLEWWQLHGQWAWSLHRASGVGIFLFLLVHVFDLALFPLAPDIYDATVASYANPYLMPMEIALVGAVIYHGLNGVRLIVLEFLEHRASAHGPAMFASVLAATIVLVLPSIVVLVRGG
jgi:succinate dehydrogenase / fumarate reductase cytochrome b subunit